MDERRFDMSDRESFRSLGWAKWFKTITPSLGSQLHRKQIYIIPGMLGLGWMLFALITTISGMASKAPPITGLGIGLLGILGIGLTMGYRLMKKITWEYWTFEPCEQGQTCTFWIELNNTNRYPLVMRAKGFDVPNATYTIPEQEFYVLPGKQRIPIVWHGHQRGIYPAVFLLSTQFPFGFGTTMAKIQTPESLVIYPYRELQEKSYCAGKKDGDTEYAVTHHRHKPSLDPDPTQLFPYRRGDDPRYIARKASSKHQEWLVRPMEPAQTPEERLIWDQWTGLSWKERMHHFSHLVWSAHEQKRPIYLQLPHGEWGPHQGDSFFHEILRALATIPEEPNG